MGTSKIQGVLWGQAPLDWAEIQEPLHRPLWETMLTVTEVGPSTHFLDLGCGAGGASVLASQREALVSGLDAAEGLIKLARERVPGGDFRVGDIESLPFDDDTFDVVFAANSVQYSEDRIAALSEFGRVCKPDGRIVASLFGPPEKVAFSAVQKAIRSALPEPPPGAGPYELSAPGKLEGLFAEARLNVLESGEGDCPFNYPSFEMYWRGNVAAGPLQSALRVINEEQLKAAARDATEAFRLDNGAILIQPNIFKYVVAAL
jgi:SAM-dependent methyltransferase